MIKGFVKGSIFIIVTETVYVVVVEAEGGVCFWRRTISNEGVVGRMKGIVEMGKSGLMKATRGCKKDLRGNERMI